jgi:hypothetical protein
MASGFLEAGRQLVVCSQARSAMVAEIMDSWLMYSVLLDWFGCTWTGERTVKEDLLPFLVELISKISYTRYLKWIVELQFGELLYSFIGFIFLVS